MFVHAYVCMHALIYVHISPRVCPYVNAGILRRRHARLRACRLRYIITYVYVYNLCVSGYGLCLYRVIIIIVIIMTAAGSR